MCVYGRITKWKECVCERESMVGELHSVCACACACESQWIYVLTYCVCIYVCVSGYRIHYVCSCNIHVHILYAFVYKFENLFAPIMCGPIQKQLVVFRLNLCIYVKLCMRKSHANHVITHFCVHGCSLTFTLRSFCSDKTETFLPHTAASAAQNNHVLSEGDMQAKNEQIIAIFLLQ